MIYKFPIGKPYFFIKKLSELKHLSNLGKEIKRDSVSIGERTRIRPKVYLIFFLRNKLKCFAKKGYSPVFENKYKYRVKRDTCYLV